MVGPFSTLVITQTLTKMALRLAPQLFEKDPRIGISIMKGEKFPRAPLFDRPIPQDPRTEAANFLRNGISRPCPFCSKILDNNVLWCGGNVGYAHGECAPWVKPNTTY